MFVPGNTDEIHKDKGGHVRWPFLEVRELLAERGIRVPEILADGTDQGWLLVEDLGDDTLANYLLRKPEASLDSYRLAVRDLARAQQRLAALPPTSIVTRRAFDHELLKWEIDHFLEWAIVARGISISESDRIAFGQIVFRQIAGARVAVVLGAPKVSPPFGR